ncbi:MAG: purple acid phosphatase family protein [Thermoanaerobaculia bacterium]
MHDRLAAGPRGFVSLVVLGMAFSRYSPAAELVRGPYLQRPGDAALAVLWTTSSASLGSVAYRRDSGAARPGRKTSGEGRSPEMASLDLWQTASETGAQLSHRITLDHLAPGSPYEYWILGDGNALSPIFRFRAPRAATEDSVLFGVIGDTTGGAVPAAIAGELSAAGVDLVLHVGDVVYPDGGAQGYDANFFGPFAPLLAVAPMMPILGDHDIRTSDGAPFFQVFDLPPNGLTPDPRFYSFRQGDAEFFCLDVESSEFGEDSEQYRWLEQGLKGSTAAWKFVTLFEPPFTSGNSNVVEQLVLSPLFERYGVDLVFSGHEHLYERTRPIRLSGPPATPVVYIVEGGGGATVSAFDPGSFSAFLAAVHGYVTVRIDGGTLRLEAHDVTGAVFDSMTLVKSGVSTDANRVPGSM